MNLRLKTHAVHADGLTDAALLVDPLDVADIAAALDRVLGDDALADDLRRRGRDRASAFTWERTAEGTAAAYAEVVS